MRIPLEFRRLQAADLTQWQAGPLAAIGGGAITVALIVVYLASNTGGRSGDERVAPQRTPERVSESAAPPVRAAVPAQPPSTDSPRVGAGSRPRPTPAPADISGRWRDTTWGHVSRIMQDGDAFHYSVRGAACRGTFQSSGSGTIRGNRVESIYRSTMPSQGRCSGAVSPDGHADPLHVRRLGVRLVRGLGRSTVAP